jgi:DNA primase
MTENLLIALDADQAGIKAAGRAARAALQGGLNVKVARLPHGSDPADLILKEGPDAWKKAIRDSKDIITFLLDVLEEHAKGRDVFRRGVETVVLPFLSDVQSPIAREQYIREIAGRLGVSESAVSEAFEKQPRLKDPTYARAAGKDALSNAPRESDRARQAFGLLSWQESLQKPSIDTAAFAKVLEETIGSESMSVMRTLDTVQLESLRFAAEILYGKSTHPEREAKALLNTMLLDKLRTELNHASAALEKAERDGSEPEIAKLMQRCKILTARIAEFSR